MPTLKLRLKKPLDTYRLIIKPGIIEKLPQQLQKYHFGQKYCLITDDRLKKTYGEKIVKNLKKAKIKVELLSIPSGEKSKSWPQVAGLAEAMLAKNISRQDCVITLGGGVVGDIGGFVASIYMRGIPYLHIPTSLLAMVDSSIGGKTGVNLTGGKNLLGSINQPKIVFIDSHFLETVPIKEIQNGLSEVIKHAVIRNKRFFYYLEKNIPKIFKNKSDFSRVTRYALRITSYNLNHKILNKIITRSAKIKAKIIQKDETETHLRMLLNYGHTFGHAIEALSKFKIAHGQAIAIGMCIINDLAVKKGLLKESHAVRIKNLLKTTGLPTELSKKISLDQLNGLIKHDKKASNGVINFVMPVKIGKAKIVPTKL